MVSLHTNFGVIKLALFADKAPATVENFLNYVKEGFYDNTIFHRVINGFMIRAVVSLLIWNKKNQANQSKTKPITK